MYKLTLTHGERAAIDWVGHRYAHGDDLANVLDASTWLQGNQWEGQEDITFAISEADAWAIKQIGDECEYRWDCFAPELASKMTQFCEGIV